MRVLVLAALLCFAWAELEEVDPAIPRDKCGVTVAVNEDERTALFITGTDKRIYRKEITPNDDWSEWAALGDVTFKGGPTVIRNYDGRLEVFGRATDSSIWHAHQLTPNDNTWTPWMPLSSNMKFSSDPVAILSSEGFLHIFAKGADNSLMHKTQFTNNTLYVWTEWSSLGGSLTSVPAAMLDAEGLIHVFVRGPDRALWHKYQIGGQEPRFIKWSEWKSLGGVLASAPRVPVALNMVNLLEIFVRASDKAYWHRCQVVSLPSNEREVDWNEWQSLGGVFSSGPAAVVNGDGLIDLFGRGADKAIWHKSQSLPDGTPRWSAWTSLKGITSTGPSLHALTNGLLEVYVRGVDKQIWMKKQMMNANGTLEFSLWKAMTGTVSAEAFAC